jgi:hypothetical protein
MILATALGAIRRRSHLERLDRDTVALLGGHSITG